MRMIPRNGSQGTLSNGQLAFEGNLFFQVRAGLADLGRHPRAVLNLKEHALGLLAERLAVSFSSAVTASASRVIPSHCLTRSINSMPIASISFAAASYSEITASAD